jgi:hypothetical protein
VIRGLVNLPAVPPRPKDSENHRSLRFGRDDKVVSSIEKHFHESSAEQQVPPLRSG